MVRRKVNCWVEPWERELAKKNDPVARERFLHKYKELVWLDPDTETRYMAMDVKYLKRGGGWYAADWLARQLAG